MMSEDESFRLKGYVFNTSREYPFIHPVSELLIMFKVKRDWGLSYQDRDIT